MHKEVGFDKYLDDGLDRSSRNDIHTSNLDIYHHNRLDARNIHDVAVRTNVRKAVNLIQPPNYHDLNKEEREMIAAFENDIQCMLHHVFSLHATHSDIAKRLSSIGETVEIFELHDWKMENTICNYIPENSSMRFYEAKWNLYCAGLVGLLKELFLAYARIQVGSARGQCTKECLPPVFYQPYKRIIDADLKSQEITCGLSTYYRAIGGMVRFLDAYNLPGNNDYV
ncbi:hypothetical protein F4604DRAFT_1918629 [Suillus subluteus]|nr:hypothetical protein F4604DRAFT_1918629 [Suillus subluteus]